jgi:hypothetical protein
MFTIVILVFELLVPLGSRPRSGPESSELGIVTIRSSVPPLSVNVKVPLNGDGK